MKTGSPCFTLSLASALFAACVTSVPAQTSQQFRDLQSEVEDLEIKQMDRDWAEQDAYWKQQEAKRRAEIQEQEQAEMNAYRQQMNPLPQPDTGTDSLVKELRDLQDEIVLSRQEAEFRQYQAALQAPLAAMTPEQRAAYWESQRLAREKATADVIQAQAEKKAQEEEARCHDPFPYPPHKWNHQTQFGKTFAIIKFRERKAGDRREELNGYTKAIGANFYKEWSRVRQGGTDWVEIVFYK